MSPSFSIQGSSRATPRATPGATHAHRPAKGRRGLLVACATLATTLLFGMGSALAQSGRLEPSDTQLDSGEYVDVYTHEGRGGERLTIAIASTEFDPYLIVLDSAGTELTQVDDSPGHGLDVYEELELPRDGAYVIGVTSARPGETGSYTLIIQGTGAAVAPPSAQPEIVAQPPEGASPKPQPRRAQTVTPRVDPPPAPIPPASPTLGTDPTRFFFLPSDASGPHNIGKPRIVTDASGGIHMAVPGYAGGNAYYMHCPADCTDPAQLATITLPTDGTAVNAMIALDAGGRPQILLNAYQSVVYATCAGDCRQQSAWRVTEILRHDPDADREVTGEAFALDPQGRPRFVMHAYRAYLGIGQPTPITLYVACDANCHDPAAWRQSRMTDQIWQESTLQFSPDGRAHLATVASADSGDIGGYMTCMVDCESGLDDAWKGLGFTWAFSDRNVERIDPAITLALTSAGRPRVMLLGHDEAGNRNLSYWACDVSDCIVEADWRANWLIDGDDLGAGLDLSLDGQDRPRAAYNADDNVFLLACDGDCLADDDSGWTLLPVDLAGTIPVDDVIPYHNCDIAAWLLRYPSIALGPDGLPRMAYIAEDISAVLGQQNPLYPECVAGVDMVIGRFTRLGSLTPSE